MGDPLNPFGEGFPPFGPGGFPPFPGIPPIGPIMPILPIGGVEPIDAKKAPPIVPTERSIAVPYFLKPENSTDDMVFRGPIRQAQDVLPLIDGGVAFNEMEHAITNAKSSVLIAFWLFEPKTKLLSASGKTWLDMLKDAAKRGVIVRVFMTDYDVGLNLMGHVNAWFRYFELIKAMGTLPAGQFQIVCSRHDAATSIPIAKLVSEKILGGNPIFDLIALALNGKSDAERKHIYQNAPALWDKLDFDAGTSKVKHKKPGTHYPIFPAVHHNKILIVDGQYAYTGGMNVEDSYHDFDTHDQPLPKPWHDAFVRVEGSMILRDFLRCYVGLWNQERVRCEKFLTDAFAQRGVAPTISKTADLELSKLIAKPTTGVTPKISAQVHRTVTKNGISPFGIPDIVRRDILDGYLLAIGMAEEFIYIENQYFRDQEMIDAIIDRAKKKRDLRVILLLPKVAEEIIDPTTADAITLHGVALQFDLLDKLKKALKTRLGLFAMVRKDKKMVYVHSKLFIIDDQFASIGSANTNPRGFRTDTELDFTWHNRQVTEQFRYDLWNEVLGSPPTLKSWKPKDFVDNWNVIANKNNGGGGVKQGFVVPFVNKDTGKRADFDVGPFT